MFRFCHPERSETESKDLGSIDGAKILRFATLTQDDRYLRFYDFAENQWENEKCTAGRVKTLPYILVEGEGIVKVKTWIQKSLTKGDFPS